MHTSSLWIDSAPASAYPKLDKDLREDALIIGGGITGLTAAYLLQKAGQSVAVIERGRIGQGETGHTTAHLTFATDARLSDLVKRFGRDHAQAAWDAGAGAMAQIQAIVAEAGIDCELRSTPAFLVEESSQFASAMDSLIFHPHHAQVGIACRETEAGSTPPLPRG